MSRRLFVAALALLPSVAFADVQHDAGLVFPLAACASLLRLGYQAYGYGNFSALILKGQGVVNHDPGPDAPKPEEQWTEARNSLRDIIAAQHPRATAARVDSLVDAWYGRAVRGEPVMSREQALMALFVQYARVQPDVGEATGMWFADLDQRAVAAKCGHPYNVPTTAAKNAFDAADRLRQSAHRLLRERLAKFWTIEHPGGSLADANEYAGVVMAEVDEDENAFSRSIEEKLGRAVQTMREAR